MDEDITTSRAKLIEAYLFENGFVHVQTSKTNDLIFSMKVGKQPYRLMVEREWLLQPSTLTTKDRLDKLQVVPFLRENIQAWIGVTTTGEEVITHVAPDAK